MPTYEFRCPHGHEFEKFYRTISGAEAQAACPECGQLAERILSPAGFAFKGSGFYLTDYGRNAHREKGGAHKPTGHESSSSTAHASTSSHEGGGASDGAKSESSDGSGSAPSETSAPAPAAESRPAAPKQSTDE